MEKLSKITLYTIRALAAAVFIALTFTMWIPKKILLLLVQLLEVLQVALVIWIFVPTITLLSPQGRSRKEIYDSIKPDLYHYHGIRDWLLRKLRLETFNW